MSQVTVTVKKVEASANDHICLSIIGVSSELEAERFAFKATGLEEGPVCTDYIEEEENGFLVNLKGDFNTSLFYKGQYWNF